ncbi:sulfatase [Cellulophaga sp. F20128]|uniref:sulfatase n=1 Tax=Cellulophaga sp. F20128 TaxID=2926413 RepID=UPI001FF5391F|nr:sulfatase [Cellulophaga sp. F20128]MCK0158044.1 sulfatase [Cellulophaga sp. F20128]
MKINIVCSLFLICLVFHSCKEKASQVNKSSDSSPNIILINIDDLGWKDLGFQGSDYYETPNLDALSQKGMVFTNGYAGAANCAPSRAVLMTGKWAQRHGIYTVLNSDRGKSKDRKLIPIKNTITLADEFTVIPQLLQKNGYKTCHAGKWHLTDNPLKKGFDVNIGGSHAGHPRSYYPPYKNVDLEAEDGKRLTDLVMDKAIEFVTNTKAPFFLNYSPYAVHTPIQPVKELVGKYEGKSSKIGQNNAEYASMVENMDANVGRLMLALKEAGKLENTFIVFTSDNGGLYGITKQKPLRAGKGSYYEGGIRVPFFFVWKGEIKEQTTSNESISNIDLFPTILKVANIKLPKEEILDGENLVPILKSEITSLDRPLYWHFPIYLQAYNAKDNENRDAKFRTRPGSVVRYGKWKLHHYFEEDVLELYDLDSDIGEENNLATTNPEQAEILFKMLNNWRKITNAPVPTTLNPEYKGGE